MALLELNAELEALVLRLELKKKRLRPLWTALLIAPFAPRLIPRQSALQDAVHHLDHLFFGWLASNLQQQRLRDDPMLDAFFAQRLGNIPERQSLRHGRTGASNFPGHIFVRVFELCGQTM